MRCRFVRGGRSVSGERKVYHVGCLHRGNRSQLRAAALLGLARYRIYAGPKSASPTYVRGKDKHWGRRKLARDR